MGLPEKINGWWAFLLGSVLLSLFSFLQKIMIGANPWGIKGYLVPIAFGGATGLAVEVLHRRFNQETQRLDEAHRKLREMGLQYQSYFNNNHAIMLLIDPATGRIADANPAACAFYGYPKQELTSLKVSDINTLSGTEVFQKMQAATSEGGGHFHFSHRLANDEIRDVEVYSGPVRYKNRRFLYSIIFDITERVRAEQEKEELIVQLRTALANVKTLSGLLPICSNCKKVRNDEGYWEQLEEYLSSQSEAQVTHGICPECRAKLYPELDQD